MSAGEIIEQIKMLPPKERKTIFYYLSQDTECDKILYDEFTLLGEDKEGSDVSFAATAQSEVTGHDCP